MIKFGVRLPVGGSIPSIEGIKKTAAEAELLKYEFVSARENLHWSAEQQLGHVSEGAREMIDEKTYIPIHYDATVIFSYLTPLTNNIKFFYSIAQLVYKHPAVWAKQIATLDVISNGRVIFGIAPGAWPLQYEKFGIPYEKRGILCDETFYGIRELWTKPSATFIGKYIKFKDIVQYPKPVQKPYPPVIFAGPAKPGVIRRVAEYSDGWFPGNLTPEEILKGKLAIKEKAKEYGRENKDFAIYLQIHARLAKTDEEAWNESKATMLADDRHKMMDKNQILNVTLIGSANRVIKQIENYKEAGVTHFQLLFIYYTIDDLIKQMELFKDQVISSF